MKSPILIFFIILNMLTANFAVAANMHIEESEESHQVHMLDESTQQNLSEAFDGDCGDHSCHISVHLLGFINESGMLASSDTSIVLTAYTDKIHFLNIDPPIKPPQA